MTGPSAMLARAVRALLLCVLLALPAGPAVAVSPDEQLADPALEARARAISLELRCVVCRNQSIDDSDAGIARDLRLLVRERLSAGDSDGAVKAAVVARYGSYVLLRPPVEPRTWPLWFGPFVLLGAGAGVGALYLRRRRGRETGPAAVAAQPLSPAEAARVQALLRAGEPR